MKQWVSARAPGKINLVLQVGRVEVTSGYHPLYTIFHCLNLYETVTLHRRSDQEIRVATHAAKPFTGTIPPGLDTAQHLAVQAINTLRAHAAGTKTQAKQIGGLDIEVAKRIPIAGGLAGGSADAAAALTAANHLWELGYSPAELAQIGAQIGADIPFGFWGGNSLGIGYGDRISPLEPGSTRHWALLLSSTGLSTPQVFARFDASLTPRLSLQTRVSEPMQRALSGSATDLAAQMGNDLQIAAVANQPTLMQTLQTCQEAGALCAQVCGSGPTVAALAQNAADAQTIAAAGLALPHIAQVIVTTGPGLAAHVIEAG